MTPRADALRSRERILSVARALDQAEPPRLNEVAKAAGVGVGTVYRHFPTTQALQEALATDSLRRMRDLLDDAAALPAREGFERVLRGVLELQLEDARVQGVMTAAGATSAEAEALRVELFERFDGLLRRAQDEGVVRPGLSIVQVERLVCGMEHAARLGPASDAGPFLEVLLAGLRPA